MSLSEHWNQDKKALGKLLSHDFRAPISQILGLCELAQIDPEKINSANYLLKIKDAAIHLDNMTAMLKNYLRLEDQLTTFSQLPTTPQPIQPLFETLHKKHAYLLDRKSLSIKFQYPDIQVAFPDRGNFLFEIISILLNNAIKFSIPNHTIVVEIAKNHFTITNTCELPSLQQQLSISKFEPFMKGASGTALAQGTGLGLYLALQYCLNLDLTMECSYVKNETSAFMVKIEKV